MKGGDVRSSSFLGGFNPLNAELNHISHLLALLGAHHILRVSRIKVKGWGLGIEVRTPLKEVVLIWLASPWGETAARILRGGYAGARVYVKKVKLVWRWVILNSLFRFCIWNTGRLPSVT